MNRIIEAFQNLPKNSKILTAVLFFVLIVGGFLYFIFLPQKADVDDMQAQVTNLNSQISIDQVKARKLEALIRENSELQQKLDDLRAQLPDEQEVSDLLRQVSDQGVQSGLDFKLWKPGPRKANPSGLYVEIPVSVEVAGGYHSVALFMDRVSKFSRIVNVSELKMQGGKSKGDKVSIQTTFVATTFAAVEKK
jgi:type IV pilus assembly protein PilO